MGNHDLQLVKSHKKRVAVIALSVVVCITAVTYFAYRSGNDADTKMNAVRPLVKYEGKLYGWSGEDAESLPQDTSYVGAIEKSYDSGSASVKKGDVDFTSNVSPVGSKLYQSLENILYVEDGDVFAKYVFIPWERQTP